MCALIPKFARAVLKIKLLGVNSVATFQNRYLTVYTGITIKSFDVRKSTPHKIQINNFTLL